MSNMIRGVDVSAANPMSIWSQIDQFGAEWVYIKATAWQRTRGHVVDSCLVAHHSRAVARNRRRGPYHFLDSRIDPVAQAEHHWETIADLDWTLRSMLDWEPGEDYGPDGRLSDRWSTPTLEHAEAWVTRFRELSGYLPVVYCGHGYTEEIGARHSDLLASCQLLVAQYPGRLGADGLPTSSPTLPAIWSSWAAWQFIGTTLDRSIATPEGLEAMSLPVGEPRTVAPEITADRIALSDPLAHD